MANQAGRIPVWTVRYRSRPIRLGANQEGTGVGLGRRQKRRRFHPAESDTAALVAGDWNILRGYGEHGSSTMAKRYQTVFDRAEALGLQFWPRSPRRRSASRAVATRAASRQQMRPDLP